MLQSLHARADSARLSSREHTIYTLTNALPWKEAHTGT